jgi:hypothetical protein
MSRIRSRSFFGSNGATAVGEIAAPSPVGVRVGVSNRVGDGMAVEVGIDPSTVGDAVSVGVPPWAVGVAVEVGEWGGIDVAEVTGVTVSVGTCVSAGVFEGLGVRVAATVHVKVGVFGGVGVGEFGRVAVGVGAPEASVAPILAIRVPQRASSPIDRPTWTTSLAIQNVASSSGSTTQAE